MINRASTSYILGFAFVCLLILLGLFAIAIFAEPPFSIAGLCLVPVPLIGIGIAAVARARNARAKVRASRRGNDR